ncbi:hypothetical protein J2X85_002520 [Microbacterium trichothecenolyticum]|uniref:hypothetical protein n=1 Tax=Microbacterium trichothecenolyticum TaxID=69370 RepID=UPI0028662D74|nr:hypothetical protein [Microbacterium trichothecenolyticum]MDR7185486.1 hypothetical protein [Microbacterium trichothecenolyticum]
METTHWALEALDSSTAEENLRAISPNVQLGRNPDPRHRLRLDGDARFSLLRLEVAGEMWGTNEPDDTITVPYPVSGRMDWEVGEERGTGNLPWLQGTTTPTFSNFGPVVEYATFFQKPPLLAFGRALYGDDRFVLRFDGSTARSIPHEQMLAETLNLAYEIASTDAFEQPLVRASPYRLLAVTVFHTFRLEGDHQARTLTAEGAAGSLPGREPVHRRLRVTADHHRRHRGGRRDRDA